MGKTATERPFRRWETTLDPAQLSAWAGAHPYAAVLDSGGAYPDPYGRYELLAGVGDTPPLTDFGALRSAPPAWRFGAFSYDLKNRFEPGLRSEGPRSVPVPELCFFEAHTLVFRERGHDRFTILAEDPEQVAADIAAAKPAEARIAGFTGFGSRFDRKAYTEAVQALRMHIREGDAYEINLSQEFRAEARLEAPEAWWQRLKALSPTPFSAYLKLGQIHLLCASPERFLQHREGRLITQPIKGTAPRGADDAEDRALARALRESEKERAENVMIVDLSRNDLHRSCRTGSVKVPQLFEVQSFPQVHHLVSTIEGELLPEKQPLEAFRDAFPPGSMTGAPKYRSCELIEQYERSARGIYAGSAGYLRPDGDFDLNVVIRSVLYDESSDTLSYHVGGAVTWDSDPEQEYEETLLKAAAIERLFRGD